MKSLGLLNLVVLALVGLAACATPESSPDAPRLAHGFHELSVNELISKELRTDIPLRIKIPAIYLPHPRPRLPGTVWATADDWTPLLKGKEDSRKHGYLIAQISMNMAYDDAKDLFFSTDGDEHSLLTDLIKQGWRDVRVNRAKVNGYPLLFVEGDQGGVIRARMVYIGLKTAGGNNVLFIHYHGRQPWSDLDDLTWNTIKSSLQASPAK